MGKSKKNKLLDYLAYIGVVLGFVGIIMLLLKFVGVW